MNNYSVLIDNINNFFDEERDQRILGHITKVCGAENFRPHLEHLKKNLANLVDEIESFSQIVVVGGTNGKGETSHCLRQLLGENNSHVMMWTSPHVLSIRERFVKANSVISYEELESIIRIVEDQYLDLDLSFYEFLFVCFLQWVKINRPEYIILEVGLGGRFDGVNIFSDPLALITSISRDHTRILGSKLKDILFEKYGIIRNHSKLITAVNQNFLRELLKSWCTRDEVELIEVSGTSYVERNRKMAAIAFYQLTGVKRQIDTVNWQCTKGRFESIKHDDREFIFVGAHNIDGHRKLLELLNFSRQNTCIGNDTLGLMMLSFSIGREDQVEEILSLYNSYPCLFDEVLVTSFSNDRAMERETIEKLNSLFEFESNWNNLFDDKYKNKKIYISGSYYFIAAFQLFLLSK